MNGDYRDGNMSAIPSVSLFRGIYNRVAKRLGVDPSYVSRVARGERKSAAVEQALAEEVRLIRDHLNNHQSTHSADGHGVDGHGVDGHRVDGHGVDGGLLHGAQIDPTHLDGASRGAARKTKFPQSSRARKSTNS